MYHIPYEADFECPKGHKFVARVTPGDKFPKVTCPVCYEEWIKANVMNGEMVGEPREVRPKVSLDSLTATLTEEGENNAPDN